MKMNRRKALIGIGSLAVGSGAALGSGAFTQVEASRDVSVETAGDGSAYLQLQSSSPYVDNSGSSNTLNIDLGENTATGSGFNEDATTTVDNIFSITHNTASGSDIEVGFVDSTSDSYSSSDLSGSTTVDLDDSQVTLNLGTSGTATIGSDSTATDGTTVNVNATIDTAVSDGSSGSSSVTIVAIDASS
jgi:hypothetical protein